MQDMIVIINKEIAVFENSQYAEIGDYTHDEELLPPPPLAFLNIYASHIVDSYRKE
jgi:hypothetical protein